MKRTLFICKYNRFRSKTAEAIFNKLNKDKSIIAKSAGLIRGGPISKEIIDSVKKEGYQIKGKPQGINVDLLKWHDTLVIVADNVPSEIFNSKRFGKKVIIWKIKDTSRNGSEEGHRIIKEIEKRVKRLIK